jgi:hypothetical protein
MKLGVICDGISRDLAHTVDVMDEFGLDYAELQFVWDAEVGDHTPEQIREIDTLLRDRGKPVSCLSRHVFAGMTSGQPPRRRCSTPGTWTRSSASSTWPMSSARRWCGS